MAALLPSVENSVDHSLTANEMPKFKAKLQRLDVFEPMDNFITILLKNNLYKLFTPNIELIPYNGTQI